MNSIRLVGRAELKYFFPAEIIQDIRDFIEPYAELDPYAAEMREHAYTVRSIYYDTEDLDFYYQKMDGWKIRRKLRVRSYNRFYPDKPVFLEIKRRFINRVVKERVAVPLSSVELIHEDHKKPKELYKDSVRNRNVLKKYVYNLSHFDLHPTALITYEREAFLGRVNNHERLTVDKNVRSYLYPDIIDLFREDDLKPILRENYILELKFDNYMPKWMGKLVHQFGLRATPIPKYCSGIDTWKELGVGEMDRTARNGS